MSNIASNIQHLKSEIPYGVTLVAVSKTKSIDNILEAYNAGQRIFGENRVQEIIAKYPLLPKDLCIHMIGHLQTNKVKSIIDKVGMIEGVDSLKLLNYIDKEAAKINTTANVLIQFHIANEETKYGFSIDEVIELFENNLIKCLKNVRVRGVMGMASFTENKAQIQKEFKALKIIFCIIKERYYKKIDYFSEVSMGMSNDYQIAIEEGTTMIRLGSAIFGPRS